MLESPRLVHSGTQMILKCDLNKKNTLIEKESWHRVKFKESIDMELQIIGYSVYFPKTELKKKTRKRLSIVRLHLNHKTNFYVKGQ